MKKKKAGKKPKKGNDNLKLLYLFVGAVLLLGAALYIFTTEDKGSTISGSPHKKSSDKEATVPASAQPAATQAMPARPVVQGERLSLTLSLPKLAIIIDDIGFNESYIDLINISVPLTLAVIPHTEYAVSAALAGSEAGLEIMMHLPMEPKGYPEADPGKWALLTNMKEEEILKNVNANFARLPDVMGVNNHMGSRFTEYAEGMKVVLEEVKKRGLFFVDSRTSYRSRAYSIAREMGIKSAERSIFLDNVQTKSAISQQMAKAVKAAKEKGKAIAIGHPSKATILTLAEIAPHLIDEGVELVFASAIVD
ncbi:MAG: divergent polysaccharide deacetylase family protein [bacterium]|nr:divergent polysaccharide deacetylase family protein [bacterium]